MVIDIISYTEAQLSGLNHEQILELKRAQAKKDRLAEKLAHEKMEEKYKDM